MCKATTALSYWKPGSYRVTFPSITLFSSSKHANKLLPLTLGNICIHRLPRQVITVDNTKTAVYQTNFLILADRSSLPSIKSCTHSSVSNASAINGRADKRACPCQHLQSQAKHFGITSRGVRRKRVSKCMGAYLPTTGQHHAKTTLDSRPHYAGRRIETTR